MSQIILFEGHITQQRIQRRDERVAIPRDGELEEIASFLKTVCAIIGTLFVVFGGMAAYMSAWLVASCFGPIALCMFLVSAYSARLARPLWYSGQPLRDLLGTDVLRAPRERWLVLERAVSCKLWIAEDSGDAQLRWEARYDQAPTTTLRVAQRPDDPSKHTPWEEGRVEIRIPLIDEGFALELIRNPTTGEEEPRFGLEVRALRTRDRLTLSIDPPDGVNLDRVPCIERDMVALPLEQARAVVDALLKRSAALNLNTPLAVQRLQQRAVQRALS